MSAVAVSYTRYKFVSPEIITEEQFWSMKQDFNKNPEFNIKPQLGSWKEKLIESAITFGVCCIGIAVFGNISDWLKKGTLAHIFEIITLGFGLGLLIPVISLFSFMTYRSDFNHYYDTPKEHIIQAPSYEKFKSGFGDGFPPQLNEE